jgi:hypothetical protein
MQPVAYDLKLLFEQLGLPSGGEEIERFIMLHSPLPQGMGIAEAPFWTAAQARLLCEELLEDADWCEAVDQLNVRLHR